VLIIVQNENARVPIHPNRRCFGKFAQNRVMEAKWNRPNVHQA